MKTFENVQDLIDFVEEIPEDHLISGVLSKSTDPFIGCIDGHINMALTGKSNYSDAYFQLLKALGIKDKYTFSSINNYANPGERKTEIINYLKSLPTHSKNI